MSKEYYTWQLRIDKTVAILGSLLPIAFVLGVVAFEFFICFTGIVWLASKIKFPIQFPIGISKISSFGLLY